MSRSDSDNLSSPSFEKRFFQATGLSFNAVMKLLGGLTLILCVLGFTVLSQGSEESTGGLESVNLNQKTEDEKFIALTQLPEDFEDKESVERIEILNAAIELGEELSKPGGQYEQKATARLIELYGARFSAEALEGLNSENSSDRLAQLRADALALSDQERVAKVDSFCVLATTNRLCRTDEKADFVALADAISNLNGEFLVDPDFSKAISEAAIKLCDSSAKPQSTATILSRLGDKFNGSPTSEVFELGLKLKDYPHYRRFYTEVDKQSSATREAKIQFLRELFTTIEKHPPQSVLTYQMTTTLLDDLLNLTDVKYVRDLMGRLEKAALTVHPKTKSYVKQAIKKVETRVSVIGRTLDLTGSNCLGLSLELPNGKPTVIVFWQCGHEESEAYIEALSHSAPFDPWANNFLLACVSTLNKEEFNVVNKMVGSSTQLDNATAHRMQGELGVDRVPYLVTLDKDDRVVRVGGPHK